MGMKYNSDYITQAIMRVDFYDDLPINTELDKDISNKALEIFPIFEPKPFINKKFNLSIEGAKVTDIVEGTDWIFHGKNREKLLIINRNYMGVQYNKYSSFDDLKSDFFAIFDTLINKFPESKIKRSGLRYTNIIDLNENNPLSWSKYLNSNLLSIFKVPDEKKSITRAFHKLELKYKNMNIKFQYGMHNPDYPATIRRKLFILDFDAFNHGDQDIEAIPSIMDAYHDKVEELFEKSIKDGLREKMNE